MMVSHTLKKSRAWPMPPSCSFPVSYIQTNDHNHDARSRQGSHGTRSRQGSHARTSILTIGPSTTSSAASFKDLCFPNALSDHTNKLLFESSSRNKFLTWVRVKLVGGCSWHGGAWHQSDHMMIHDTSTIGMLQHTFHTSARHRGEENRDTCVIHEACQSIMPIMIHDNRSAQQITFRSPFWPAPHSSRTWRTLFRGISCRSRAATKLCATSSVISMGTMSVTSPHSLESVTPWGKNMVMTW